ncbi:DUF6877 family protein [Virgibacillus halophilus]|uniref:DUF6877 domain-containing protein n=1 Tax=Tigheibacillus halophilus TaxID=361280 RepID=A0ABU5C7X9_9BACI|nr:hypothetical protein [Virgibacillus halophilus]
MSPLSKIVEIAHRLPYSVLTDIQHRMGDWIASGGDENDPYIEQQLRYARLFVEERTGK